LAWQNIELGKSQQTEIVIYFQANKWGFSDGKLHFNSCIQTQKEEPHTSRPVTNTHPIQGRVTNAHPVLFPFNAREQDASLLDNVRSQIQCCVQILPHLCRKKRQEATTSK
jgi:hypothetical protein